MLYLIVIPFEKIAYRQNILTCTETKLDHFVPNRYLARKHIRRYGDETKTGLGQKWRVWWCKLGCFVYIASLVAAMVRVPGVEPGSQPWEGHIIAAIRYPHFFKFGRRPAPGTRAKPA